MTVDDGSQEWWHIGTPSLVDVNVWTLNQATDYLDMPFPGPLNRAAELLFARPHLPGCLAG
jgi:hypothetical protein